jgi:ferritin-like metal-binding protein YciE
MAAEELNTRDAKLVQWLQEAQAKETELEADLKAHIALTEKQSYKKRLRRHLTETREHKRQVARRIKQIGGSVDGGPVPGAVTALAGKTVAVVKGQAGVLRAALTDQAETHLRNAQEELREENVEITLYRQIETFATGVGDRETARLAATIRRDEERMANYLNAELPRLVRALIRAAIPPQERASRKPGRRKPAPRGSAVRAATSTAGRRPQRTAA